MSKLTVKVPFSQGMRPGKATAVAHFIAVSVKPIRVQLPGGDIYAPAMYEAAAKTGARSGLAKKTTKGLDAMVRSGLAVLNSGSATTILLEMRVHDDSISAKLVGKGCKKPKRNLIKQLDMVAAKKSLEYETSSSASTFTIKFTV